MSPCVKDTNGYRTPCWIIIFHIETAINAAIAGIATSGFITLWYLYTELEKAAKLLHAKKGIAGQTSNSPHMQREPQIVQGSQTLIFKHTQIKYYWLYIP